MIKIAVVGGTGKMGGRHLEAFSRIENAKVVGIVGRNKSRLKEIAETYDILPFTSLEELLHETEVDVIDICTPTHAHEKFAIEAAKAKKHVICEKPLGLSKDEAKKIIDECGLQGVKLFVGHTLRFFPEYADARKQVQNGAIGTPGVVRLNRGGPHPGERGIWYGDETLSGGVFLDLGIHDFDWLRWTFGEVERVMARHVKRSGEEGGALEFGLAILVMEDGTIAHVESSWAEPAFEASFELAGSLGMITYNSTESFPVRLHIRKQATEPLTGAAVPKNVLKKDPYERMLEHFIDCLQGKCEPVITANDALKAIEVAEAVTQSARTGEPVQLLDKGVTQ